MEKIPPPTMPPSAIATSSASLKGLPLLKVLLYLSSKKSGVKFINVHCEHTATSHEHDGSIIL